MTKGHPWQPSAQMCRKYSWPAGELHLLFLKESWKRFIQPSRLHLWTHRWQLTRKGMRFMLGRASKPYASQEPYILWQLHRCSFQRLHKRRALLQESLSSRKPELWLLSGVHSSFLVPACPHRASSNRGDCYRKQCCLVKLLTFYLYLVTRGT